MGASSKGLSSPWIVRKQKEIPLSKLYQPATCGGRFPGAGNLAKILLDRGKIEARERNLGHNRPHYAGHFARHKGPDIARLTISPVSVTRFAVNSYEQAQPNVKTVKGRGTKRQGVLVLLPQSQLKVFRGNFISRRAQGIKKVNSLAFQAVSLGLTGHTTARGPFRSTKFYATGGFVLLQNAPNVVQHYRRYKPHPSEGSSVPMLEKK